MAITVGVFAESGGGKTTSIVINPDGSFNESNYLGMPPESTLVINADGKELPFPSGGKWVLGKNYLKISDTPTIKSALRTINTKTAVKAVFIDTINGIMLDKEMNDIKKKTYDKWADLAQEIYELIVFCNMELRNDLIVYFGGHVGIYTDTDGNESKCLITNGKKLEKIRLETKLPIVLFGAVNKGENNKNSFVFQTQASRSTAKTPIGMFEDFEIPNSLKLVDDTIRKYYDIK